MELKEFREMTKEEIEEFAKKEWKDEKMQQYLIKNYNYYINSRNEIFEIEKPSQLGIHKVIWYDDELPADEVPHKSLEVFLDYNFKFNHNIYRNLLEEHKEMFFRVADNNKIYVTTHFYYDNLEAQDRKLTDDELSDLITIKDEQIEKYKERLIKYYNRYKEHIWCEGYWVNR